MSRNIALDILKLSLVFMVVGLHAGFLKDISELGQYLTVNGLFRIAVPIFLLINGFYFYNILEKGKSLYWFKRVSLLYLFWMLFYSYFWFRPDDYSFLELAKVVHTLIFGYFHLWYLPGMMGAALLMIFFKKSSTKVIVLSMLITFLIGVLIQYIGNYHLINNTIVDKLFNMTWVHRNFVFLAFPFFSIGFLINKFDVQKKISLGTWILLSLIGILLLLMESYFDYINPLRDGGFDNFISLIIVCPALFLVFINLDFQGKSKQLSFYATGVYFIHPIFLTVYRHFATIDGTILTFVVIVSSIIASFFLIKINNRIKFIL